MHYESCPLGHDKLDTTARYTRVATGLIADIQSPLEHLLDRRRRTGKPSNKKTDNKKPDNDEPPTK